MIKIQNYPAQCYRNLYVLAFEKVRFVEIGYQLEL